MEMHDCENIVICFGAIGVEIAQAFATYTSHQNLDGSPRVLVFGHEVALVNLPDILKQSGLVFLIGDETAASANEDLANVAALVRAAGAVMLTLVCANGKAPEGRCPETGNPQFNLGSAAVVELSRASGTGDGGPFAQQALDIITGLCGMRNNNDSIAGVDLEDIRTVSACPEGGLIYREMDIRHDLPVWLELRSAKSLITWIRQAEFSLATLKQLVLHLRSQCPEDVNIVFGTVQDASLPLGESRAGMLIKCH